MARLPFLQPFLVFLSEDPAVRTMQMSLLLLAVLVVFLVFYVLRDVVLRTDSFAYQLLCILLVAFLPGIGFLAYLLIRPARTVRQREMDRILLEVHARLTQRPQQQPQQKPQPQQQQKHGKKPH